MNAREFLNLMGDEAYKALDEMAERAQQWDFENSWDRQDPAPKTRGLYEVKDNVEREDVKEIKRQSATLVSTVQVPLKHRERMLIELLERATFASTWSPFS